MFAIFSPRDSDAQIRVENIVIKFDKQRTKVILEQAVAGITILYFQGHVMLYLSYNIGQAYAIHSLHGYGGENNLTYLLNRGTVPSLLLGENSKKGSLLKRLTLMKVIK